LSDEEAGGLGQLKGMGEGWRDVLEVHADPADVTHIRMQQRLDGEIGF
jgi:hypothetical protein